MKQLVLNFSDPNYTITVTKEKVVGADNHIVFRAQVQGTNYDDKFEMFLDNENLTLLLTFLENNK